MQRLAEQVNFLGKVPTFYVDSKTKHYSIFALIMSFLVYICTISLTGYFLIDLFQKTKSRVIYNKVEEPFPIIDYEGIPYMINLMNMRLQPYEDADKLFRFATYRLEGEEHVSYTMERCQEKHFGKYWDLFKGIPDLNSYYCQPLGLNNTFYGMYGDTQKGYFNHDIDLRRCVDGLYNDADGNPLSGCHNRTYINTLLDESYINYAHLDFSIDNNNYDKPINPVMKINTYGVTTSQFTRYYFKRKLVNYFTDVGLVFEENISQTVVQQASNMYIITGKGLNSWFEKFAQFTFLSADYTEEYYRSYTKAQQVIASIGGVLGGVKFLSFLIVDFFTDNYYFTSIMNQLFDFKQQKRSITRSTQNINVVGSVNIIKPPKKDFNVSACQASFWTICKSNKKEYRYLQTAKRLIKESMSIHTIMRTQLELEKVKTVLFNDDELEMFDALKYVNFQNFVIGKNEQKNRNEIQLSGISNIPKTSVTPMIEGVNVGLETELNPQIGKKIRIETLLNNFF